MIMQIRHFFFTKTFKKHAQLNSNLVGCGCWILYMLAPCIYPKWLLVTYVSGRRAITLPSWFCKLFFFYMNGKNYWNYMYIITFYH